MAKRSGTRNWVEYLAARAAFGALCWSPLPIARGLAALLASAVFRLTPKWRRIGLRNLALAFPEQSQSWREQTLRESYRNLGRVLLALARLPRLTSRNIGDWIGYDGYEHFERGLAQGRGVIFLTAHLGCWELSSAAHALLGNPMSVMVRPLDNPLLDAFIDRRRTLFGNRTIGKSNAAKTVLRTLRDNQAVGILADQNAAGEDGIFVDVFGRQASATKGVAQLAARSGAAVIPGFAFWNAETRRYVLKFYPPIEVRTSNDRDQDAADNTQRFQAAIERAVREHPGQWLWVHRRWKRRPPGEPAVYD